MIASVTRRKKHANAQLLVHVKVNANHAHAQQRRVVAAMVATTLKFASATLVTFAIAQLLLLVVAIVVITVSANQSNLISFLLI
ncbi:hypothetical protein J6W20_00710 [bacterium]|nr:hypothetical protein [bacterium]